MGSRLVAGLFRMGSKSIRVVLVVVAMLAVFAAVQAANQRIAAQQSAQPSGDPAPIYTRQPYAGGYGPQSSPSPSSTPDVQKPEVQLALRFTAAWLDTSGGKDAWLDRMRPAANPNFIDALATTDLGRVPQGQLTGPDGGFVRLDPTVHADAWVTVHTTAGDFRVYSARRNMSDEWWVNSIEPVGTP